jgi:hypothetical protein
VEALVALAERAADENADNNHRGQFGGVAKVREAGVVASSGRHCHVVTRHIVTRQT